MKFKTFRALVVVAGLGVAIGAVVLFMSNEREQVAAFEAQRADAPVRQGRGTQAVPPVQEDPQRAQAAAQPSGTADTAPTAQPDATPAGLPMRPLDGRILELVRTNISGDKVKDAFRGEKWKVNIYKDAGETQPNRLKIDYDRDEKWDEKWSFERTGSNTEVKRFDAPADDENYTVEYRLRGGRWVPKTP